MKTTIKRPDGTTIEIEGTADEVGQVAREAQGGVLPHVGEGAPFIRPCEPTIDPTLPVYPFWPQRWAAPNPGDIKPIIIFSDRTVESASTLSTRSTDVGH